LKCDDPDAVDETATVAEDSTNNAINVLANGIPVVTERMPEARFVFLKPPSWDELVDRYLGAAARALGPEAVARAPLAASARFRPSGSP